MEDYWNYDIKCPYYVGNKANEIHCSGNTKFRFYTKKMTRQMLSKCCANGGGNCTFARSMSEDFESGKKQTWGAEPIPI